MPRALWSGSISFGLVNIPVKLYNAVSPKDIRFHLLHDADLVRIKQKRVCPADGQEVPPEHLVKGYEIEPDRYVALTPQELEALDPEVTHSVDIQDFVPLEQIDPIYFEHSYYVLPDGRAHKAYALLLAAMKNTGKVAVARIVLRTKQYLAVLRPMDDVFGLETMYFADEIVKREAFADRPAVTDIKIDPRELAMAQQLIGTLSADFEPQKYHDEYRERVLELIESKAEGATLAPQPAPAPSAKVINLMEALEASIAASKKQQPAGKEPPREKNKDKGTKKRRKA